MDRADIRDYAARFDISATECARIAAVAFDEAEFVMIWENENWWTDESAAEEMDA